MAVAIAPGPAGRPALARFERQFSENVNELSVPVNLVNFGQAVDFPLLLGVTLALFGAATLAHLLFVSVARRRRQVALLKVLGFVRRQVLATTCWQALTVVVIGLVIGVPVGIAVGESVWRTFASHLGAVPGGRSARRGSWRSWRGHRRGRRRARADSGAARGARAARRGAA